MSALMSPQEQDFSLASDPSWWLNELFHRCQLDPNQSAVDFVQHAYRHSLESTELVTLGLQIFAQRILLEVDHHRPVSTFLFSEPTNTTTITATTTPAGSENDTTLPTMASPPFSFAPHPSIQNVPPNPPVSTTRPTMRKKSKKSTSTAPTKTTTTTTTKKTITTTTPNADDDMEVDEATRPRGIATAEGLQLPVEQLCIETGRVLQRFQTGFDAQKTISTCSQPHFFYYAVVGKNKGTPPHIYKKYFWRLVGSSHRPGGCPCHLGFRKKPPPINTKTKINNNTTTNSNTNNNTKAKTKANTSNSATANSKTKITKNDTIDTTTDTLNTTNNKTKTNSTTTTTSSQVFRRDPTRDMPVEKLCVETGRILERFATAEEAHHSVSDSGPAQFCNFKKVLEGKDGFYHHKYKGYFWRLAGSNNLPTTMPARAKKKDSAVKPPASSPFLQTKKRGRSSEIVSASKRSKARAGTSLATPRKGKSDENHLTITPFIDEDVNNHKSFTPPRRSRRLLAEAPHIEVTEI